MHTLVRVFFNAMSPELLTSPETTTPLDEFKSATRVVVETHPAIPSQYRPYMLRSIDRLTTAEPNPEAFTLQEIDHFDRRTAEIKRHYADRMAEPEMSYDGNFAADVEAWLAGDATVTRSTIESRFGKKTEEERSEQPAAAREAGGNHDPARQMSGLTLERTERSERAMPARPVRRPRPIRPAKPERSWSAAAQMADAAPGTPEDPIDSDVADEPVLPEAVAEWWRSVVDRLMALRAESADPRARLDLLAGLEHKIRTPDETIAASDRRMIERPEAVEETVEATVRESAREPETAARESSQESSQEPGVAAGETGAAAAEVGEAPDEIDERPAPADLIENGPEQPAVPEDRDELVVPEPFWPERAADLPDDTADEDGETMFAPELLEDTAPASREDMLVLEEPAPDRLDLPDRLDGGPVEITQLGESVAEERLAIPSGSEDSTDAAEHLPGESTVQMQDELPEAIERVARVADEHLPAADSPADSLPELAEWQPFQREAPMFDRVERRFERIVGDLPTEPALLELPESSPDQDAAVMNRRHGTALVDK